MIYAILLILAVIVAFVAFGFIAYTAGRARGFEACYKLSNNKPLWESTATTSSAPAARKPHKAASSGEPASREPCNPVLYDALPAEFATRDVTRYFVGLGKSPNYARRTGAFILNYWIEQGLVTHFRHGHYRKVSPPQR